MTKTKFTSESVCAGHPDKICDQISDAIVDAVLAVDKKGKVAVEVLVSENKIILAGEVTSMVKVDYKKIVREQVKRLGYDNDQLKFTYKSPIEVYIHSQSPEIAIGVNKKGAGDQGMMFGYACRESESLMPMPITIAHNLVRMIDQVRENLTIKHLRPDGKSQVTVDYRNGKPVGVSNVVLAMPHDEEIDVSDVKNEAYKHIVGPVLEQFGFKVRKDQVIVNGTGVWHFSGPAADTGLTGRKIVVDTYGGYARVGGGAFSGKDPTKVDRSGAYAARFLAKNIVAAKLAEKAEVMLAYYIGAKKPLMLEIETFGTAKKSLKVIYDFAKKISDFSVEDILEKLDLRKPVYLKTAAYGHFGREGFSWEEIISA